MEKNENKSTCLGENDGIFNIDVNHLSFIKTKDKSSDANQKNFVIHSFNGKPKIIIKSAYIPFGIEFYNKKQVLNIELYPKKNNLHNNIISSISTFEKNLMENFSKNPEYSNLTFHSSLKESKKHVHLRTYCAPSMSTFTIIKNEKINIIQSSIKSNNCDIELDLGTMWVNNTNYGIIWYVKQIQIV
jgi:hypothetical protein